MNALSVLLIDEHPGFRRVAALLLQAHAATTLHIAGTSPGGEDALIQACQACPRVILLGVGLYNLSGLQLIQPLRSTVPEACIIVMGPMDMSIYQRIAHEAGADMFVAKATLSRDLLPILRQIIGDSSLSSSGTALAPSRVFPEDAAENPEQND